MPHYINSIIGGEWYLGTLVIFYMIAPLLYKYINTLERAFYSFIGSVALSCLNVIISQVGVPVQDSNIYFAYIRSFSLFSQLPVIMIGVILFFLFHKCAILDKVENKKFFSYSILCLSILMLVGELYEKNSLIILSTAARYGIWFGGVIISQMIWQSGIINNIVFQKLGKNSYPIYLFHILLITCYNKFIIFDFGDGIINWAVKYMVVLIFSYLISILASRCIDKPINCFIDKMKEHFYKY